MPHKFWDWYHRQVKRPGDADLEKEDVIELFKEWEKLGKPKPDSKGKQKGFIDPELLEWLIPWPLTPSDLACSDLDCTHQPPAESRWVEGTD